MKISDIINEDITDGAGKINPEHESVFSNTSTLPNQNMNRGSSYLHAMFLKALASAGAGDTPDGPMPEKNWAGGDPVMTPFHPVEYEMIDRAMKHVGDTRSKSWGDKRSQEPESVHKSSPVQARKPVELKRKKK